MAHDPGSRRANLSALAPWIAPAALSLYVKIVVLLQAGICVRCISLGGQSLGEKFGDVSFFRHDLFVVLFAFPAMFMAVQTRLGPRATLAVTAVASTLVYLLLFAQLQCLQSVGMFVSPGLLRDALAWAWENPRRTGAYFALTDQLLLIGGTFWIAGTWWWSARHIRRPHVDQLRRWMTPAGWTASAVLLLVTLLVPWIPRIATTPYHRSALSWALFPSRVRGTLPRSEFAGLSTKELTAAYRAMSAAPAPSRDPRYWGTMAGADVLIVVFETGPAQTLDVTGDLADFPNLRRLRGRAFVAAEHYGTAPLTNRSWLSIFASWYPSPFSFDRAFEGPGSLLPGVISRARTAGYETGLYSRAEPSRLVPGDNERLRAFGFQNIRYPPSAGRSLDLDMEIARERMAVDLLKKDLAGWVQSDRRFMATYFPIIGHAPWQDVTNGRARTVLERGKALMVLQDGWLGELLDELQRHDRLERTLIVVTSDHGIRTRKEDPDFRLGMIDDISFHVPLLVYAPQVLASTVVVPWVTSHVDIPPTVLDLLGLERDTDTEQGIAIWNELVAERVTFQLASLYLGSDGFARNGRFHMYGHLTGRVYEAPEMRFDAADELPKNSQAGADAIDLLERFNALQAEWTLRHRASTDTPPF